MELPRDAHPVIERLPRHEARGDRPPDGLDPALALAISAPVMVPVPSERRRPVNEASPLFAAGSRIAPASMISLPSTTGSVCFCTRITFSPLSS